jgi:Tfp pilus assembly protein PilF
MSFAQVRPWPSSIERRGTARLRARSGLLVVIAAVLAVTTVAACSNKSEAQLAQEALTAGLAAHQAGKLDEAEKDYRIVLQHDPQNKYAYFNLGLIAQTQNQLPSAENDYRIALSIDPNFTSPLWNLALIRGGAGDPVEAISLWRQYIKLDPSAPGAHWNLALLLRAQGDKAGGDAEMATALKLDPNLKDPGSGAAASPPATNGPQPSASAAAPSSSP